MLLQGSYDGSSFFDLLRHDHPHLLPFQHLPQLASGTGNILEAVPFATTVLALRFADGVIMAVRHKKMPVEGVQFHPESILAEEGKKVLQNFLDYY